MLHCFWSFMRITFVCVGIKEQWNTHESEVKVGRVHLCRVAGNTVWSHMATDVPLLSDGNALTAICCFTLLFFKVIESDWGLLGLVSGAVLFSWTRTKTRTKKISNSFTGTRTRTIDVQKNEKWIKTKKIAAELIKN